jgi:transposase-like protein
MVPIFGTFCAVRGLWSWLKKAFELEIATKLAQANELATRGKLQSEIARTLGVSVMTLHRWRKAQRCTRGGSARSVAQPARPNS